MTALCIVLSSCSAPGGGGKKDAAQEIKTEYGSVSSADMTASVKADYGGNEFEYKLKYSGSPESGRLFVLAPDEIAGLEATVSSSGSEMVFDGAELYAGSPDSDGLSPVWALPVLLDAWHGGAVTSSYGDRVGGCSSVALTTEISNTVSQTTWFDAKTHLPLKSEIYSGGSAVITCEFENVSLEYAPGTAAR